MALADVVLMCLRVSRDVEKEGGLGVHLAAAASSMASSVAKLPEVGEVLVLDSRELFNYIQDRDFRSSLTILELVEPELEGEPEDDDHEGQHKKKKKKEKKKKEKKDDSRSLICGAYRAEMLGATCAAAAAPPLIAMCAPDGEIVTDPPECWHDTEVVVSAAEYKSSGATHSISRCTAVTAGSSTHPRKRKR